ncbi:MAG: hypothetical protein Q8R15_02545 [Candidatus Micrarchaeota archaeon]|nr:hypothetical protein [Candidatus Micrarchaeota archaeon]
MVKALLKRAWQDTRLTARELFSPLRHEIETQYLNGEMSDAYWRVVKKIARDPFFKKFPWKEHSLAMFAREPIKEGVPPSELAKCWEVVAREILPKAEEAGDPNLFFYSQAEMLNRNPEALGIIARELLPHVPPYHWRDLFKSFQDYAKHRPSLADLRRQIDIAKTYHATGKYFYDKTASANFGKLAPIGSGIKRYRFLKTGSALIPLGGKLHGYIVRVLSREAYGAWLAAHKAGLQVEEILHRNGKPRAYLTKGGMMRVYTKFAGEHLEKFFRENPGHSEEIQRQIQQIKIGLVGLGIEHGHFDNNLVVELVDKKPVVRLIDFDAAKVAAA